MLRALLTTEAAAAADEAEFFQNLTLGLAQQAGRRPTAPPHQPLELETEFADGRAIIPGAVLSFSENSFRVLGYLPLGPRSGGSADSNSARINGTGNANAALEAASQILSQMFGAAQEAFEPVRPAK